MRQRRAPDKDESVSTLLVGFAGEGPQPPILLPKGGALFLDRDKFQSSLAADVPADLAAFHGRLTGPAWTRSAGPLTDPAYPTKPSWYMVTTEDRRSPGGPAHHVPADSVDGKAGGGESLRLRIATGRRGGPRQTGRVRGRRAPVNGRWRTEAQSSCRRGHIRGWPLSK
jgi:hypothetical protein